MAGGSLYYRYAKDSEFGVATVTQAERPQA